MVYAAVFQPLKKRDHQAAPQPINLQSLSSGAFKSLQVHSIGILLKTTEASVSPIPESESEDGIHTVVSWGKSPLVIPNGSPC